MKKDSNNLDDISKLEVIGEHDNLITVSTRISRVDSGEVSAAVVWTRIRLDGQWKSNVVMEARTVLRRGR